MKDMIPFRRGDGLTTTDIFKDFFGRDLVDEFFSNNSFSPVVMGGFRADIKETESEYIVEAELPGYNKKDIEIDLRNNRLRISAKKDEELKEEKGDYIRRERRVGEASRSFIVSGIRHKDVKAEYSDGVLKVVLPKEGENKAEGRRIDIN